METENKQIPENFYKVEENLSLLHGMGENLRIVSEGINDEDKGLATALYGIRVIEGQIQEIENKLLNRTTSTYNEKKRSLKE